MKFSLLCFIKFHRVPKRNILFFIGLILFLCCDLCVGLFNFSEVGITLPAALEKVIAPAMWLFYLPSQVLITISAGANATFDKKR